MKKKAPQTASSAVKKMSPVVSGMMMTGTIFGSASILLPGVVSQVGVGSFFLMLFFYLILSYACTMLANYVFGDLLSKTPENDESLRRPLQYCTERAFGKKSWLNMLFTCIQISSNLSLVVSCTMFAATILESALPILPLNLNSSNLTRIWLLITFLGLLPTQMIGSFKELGFVGPSAVFFSVTALFLVIVSGYIVQANNILPPDPLTKSVLEKSLPWIDYTPPYTFFSVSGTIFFSLAGYMLVLPSLAAIDPDTESLNRTVTTSAICVYILYCAAGYVTYLLFSDYVIEVSIVDTIQRIAKGAENSTLLVLAKIIEALLVLHFVCAICLAGNPVYLYLESVFTVPNEFCWKRFILRTLIFGACNLIVIVFPKLSQFVSWLGGGFLFNLATFVPIILYLCLCETSLTTKVFCWFLFTLSLVIAIGVNYVGLAVLL
ncbi:sodium-coupled neutral amino acid symporter 2-like [Clytia hemisphaerica]